MKYKNETQYSLGKFSLYCIAPSLLNLTMLKTKNLSQIVGMRLARWDAFSARACLIKLSSMKVLALNRYITTPSTEPLAAFLHFNFQSFVNLSWPKRGPIMVFIIRFEFRIR